MSVSSSTTKTRGMGRPPFLFAVMAVRSGSKTMRLPVCPHPLCFPPHPLQFRAASVKINLGNINVAGPQGAGIPHGPARVAAPLNTAILDCTTSLLYPLSAGIARWGVVIGFVLALIFSRRCWVFQNSTPHFMSPAGRWGGRATRPGYNPGRSFRLLI